MKIRIEAKFKNEAFIQARLAAGFETQTAMAAAIGVHLSLINSYENLHNYPATEITIRRIERIFKRPIEDFWPDELKIAIDRKIGKKLKKVVDLKTLPEWMEPKKFLGPVEALEAKELKDILSNALKCLTSREAEVLTLRYGIGSNGDEWTFDELAARFGRSPERMRQIEAKALRKLKHPSRNKFEKTGYVKKKEWWWEINQ